MNNKNRVGWLSPLDSYRSLAALAVFGFHIAGLSPSSGAIGAWTTPLGNAAVSLFFALSGFLLYRPFAASAFDSGPRIPTGRFVLRRIARIVPLYWLVLTIHLFILGHSDATTWGDYATAYGLIQNFRGDKVFIPPFVAWSLCIELWFSFCLPFIALTLRKLGDGRDLRTRFVVQLGGIAWLAASASVFRIWALTRDPNKGTILWFPAYFDWFAAGLALAVLTTFWTISHPPLAVRRLARQPILLVLGVTSYWVVTRLKIPGGLTAPTVFQTHVQFLMQTAMTFFLIAAAVLPGSVLGSGSPSRATRLLGWLAPLSYGIYLIHPLVIDEVLIRWGPTQMPLAAISLPVTIVAAFAAHHAVEAPASRFADRYLRTSSQAPAPGPKSEPDTDAEPVRAPAPALPATPPATILSRMSTLGLIAAAWSLVITVLAQPGRYVADARYELFANPLTRLGRSLSLWDGTRDFGRVSEEFWPGLVLFSSIVTSLGAPAWLSERLLHAALLSIACTGAMALSRVLGRKDVITTVFAGAIYAFGPFSATYLIPSPLYVSYALAPWAVVGVVRSAQGRSTLRWAGATALAIFLVGNADIPGLAFAVVPAIVTWAAYLVGRPSTRRPLATYTAATFAVTGLASAAMMSKTLAGASALSHRLVETESAAAVSASSSIAESMRGMGFWLSYFELGPIPVRTQTQLYLSNPLLVLVTFIPIIVGVAILVRRRRPSDLLALTWFVVGVVLMSGPHPVGAPSPYGSFLLDLYEQSDLAFGFRSTHKAGVCVALGTAILGSSGLAQLPRLIPTPSTIPLSARYIPVLAVLLAYTQPFWRTPLYDPAFQSDEIPEHWHQVEDWFASNPPEGRVLVLPGSTNNGYRWGSVGDDLLDPIVPNRLVASTLPLSNPIAADITRALDAMASSSRYEAGSLTRLATRLGVSHVVIRNDLDWQLQNLSRPRDLEPLRHDPDLELQASFGIEGLFSTASTGPGSDPVESQLPAVEIYAVISSSPSDSFVVLPADQGPRRTLLSGTGEGLTAAASAGVLGPNRPVQFATSVDPSTLSEVTGDIALVVLTDTNRQAERRINHYGFVSVPLLADQAASSTTVNHWLPSPNLSAAQTQRSLTNAVVHSSIDPWLLEEEYQPIRALDMNVGTSWTIPLLVQNEMQVWSIQFDEANKSAVVQLDLQDSAGRLQNIEILIDDVPAVASRDGERITVRPEQPFRSVEVRFAKTEPGLSAIGIREIRFSHDHPEIRTVLPTRLVDLLRNDSAAANALVDTPIAVVFADRGESSSVISREFNLWRDDEFTLNVAVHVNAEILADTEDQAIQRWPQNGWCFTDAVTLDGEPVSVRLRSDGTSSETLVLCGPEALRLGAGTHHFGISAPLGTSLGAISLRSSQSPSAELRAEPVELSDATPLREGDLVLSTMSSDIAWELTSGSGTDAEPIDFHGLMAWEIAETASYAAPSHSQARSLNIALSVTAVGLLGAAALIAGVGSPGGPMARSMAPTSLRTRPTNASTSDRRTNRVTLLLGSELVAFSLVGGMSWFFIGSLGLCGTAGMFVVSRRASVGGQFGLAAIGLAAVSMHTAWPLFDANLGLLMPRADAQFARLVLGGLLGATVSACLGLSSSLDQAADTPNKPAHPNTEML